MKKPDFVYVSYIAATPERVWAAMLEPKFTRQFWTFSHDGPWTAGTEIHTFGRDGQPECDAKILECDPPRRLSLTWLRARIDGAFRDMPKAVATVVLEPMGEVVRLTVTETHEDPVDESYLDGAREGWPVSISRLKTLVETGQPLPRIGG